MIDLLTVDQYEAVTQPLESGSVELAAIHLGKSAKAISYLRSTARAKLKAAGYTLPDLRREKRSGCRRIPSIPISQ